MVPWREFKAHKGPASNKAVIDVLVGAPDPAWERGRRTFTVQGSNPRSMPPETSPMKSMAPGESALPERIRINSPLLLSIVGNLQIQWLFRDKDSVVLLRPFKALRQNWQKLEQVYETLKKKHAGTKTQPGDFAQEGDLTSSENEATLAEKENSGGATNLLNFAPWNGDDANDEETESELALQHMHVLMDFVNNFVMARQRYIDSAQCQKVTFSDMWLLFQPGDDVFEANGTQAYRIYAIQTPRHKAIPPWENDTTLEPAFEPPPPGGGGPAPWRSSTYTGDDVPFRLWCVYIDSDGFSLGPVTISRDIAPFVGEKSVVELPLVPLRFRTPMLKNALSKYGYTSESSLSELREALVTRGQQFVEMNMIRHAYYKGPAHKARNRLEGQVVVDMTHAYNIGRGTPPPPAPLFYYWARGPVHPPRLDQQQRSCDAGCCVDDVVWSDQFMDEWRNAMFRDSLIPMDRDQTPSIAAAERLIMDVMAAHESKLITKDDYLIMSERVFGFMLQTRKWVELNLGYLSTVEYNRFEDITSRLGSKKVVRTAFDELVLPSGHKEVILSLVAQHFRDEENHEVDIFKGKGKGLILLLHGAPGVGKTSTAEGVAEAFRKPLLQITCGKCLPIHFECRLNMYVGDLGFNARDVEEALARNFELASRWDCVLLLDEADVFLASRSRADSSSDLNRNALVAVFLRVLEYYTGILLLTTNRIGDFDEAFASRVHVSLEYPQLTKASTTSILKLNIRMIRKRFEESKRKIEIDEVDISASFLDYWRDNEKARLNGRQIRNACQTALALAEFEAQGGSHEAIVDPDATVHLQASHFDTVLKAYLDFNKYLKDIYGVYQDERATEKGYRAPHSVATNAAGTMQPVPQYGGSQPNSFPGMHLYQNPQMESLQYQDHQVPAASQQIFQPSPQSQQGYYMPTQQRGYAVLPQSINASVPYYPQPALRNDNPSLQVEHGISQGGNDTSAGHDPKPQASYSFASGAQYVHPHTTGTRP